MSGPVDRWANAFVQNAMNWCVDGGVDPIDSDLKLVHSPYRNGIVAYMPAVTDMMYRFSPCTLSDAFFEKALDIVIRDSMFFTIGIGTGPGYCNTPLQFAVAVGECRLQSDYTRLQRILGSAMALMANMCVYSNDVTIDTSGVLTENDTSIPPQLTLAADCEDLARLNVVVVTALQNGKNIQSPIVVAMQRLARQFVPIQLLCTVSAPQVTSTVETSTDETTSGGSAHYTTALIPVTTFVAFLKRGHEALSAFDLRTSRKNQVYDDAFRRAIINMPTLPSMCPPGLIEHVLILEGTGYTEVLQEGISGIKLSPFLREPVLQRFFLRQALQLNGMKPDALDYTMTCEDNSDFYNGMSVTFFTSWFDDTVQHLLNLSPSSSSFSFPVDTPYEFAFYSIPVPQKRTKLEYGIHTCALTHKKGNIQSLRLIQGSTIISVKIMKQCDCYKNE